MFLPDFGFLEYQYQTKSKCHKKLEFFLDISDPGSFGRGREDGAVAHEPPGCAQGGRARSGG